MAILRQILNGKNQSVILLKIKVELDELSWILRLKESNEGLEKVMPLPVMHYSEKVMHYISITFGEKVMHYFSITSNG